jgi:hypothetical protein
VSEDSHSWSAKAFYYGFPNDVASLMTQSAAPPTKTSRAAWVLLFALCGEIALGVLILRGGGPNETNFFALFAILQFPYFFALALIVLVRKQFALDLAGGIGMAVSGCALLAEGILAVTATLFWPWTVEGDAQTYIVLLLLVASNAVIFCASLVLRKRRWSLFLLGFFAFIGYCAAVPWALKTLPHVQHVGRGGDSPARLPISQTGMKITPADPRP